MKDTRRRCDGCGKLMKRRPMADKLTCHAKAGARLWHMSCLMAATKNLRNKS